MIRLVDIAGQTFGRLTAIKQHDSQAAGARWECQCNCGNKTIVNSLKLRTGKTKSCGCYTKENPSHLIHGQANKTKTYRTWKEMRQRCSNPNATQYKWYGTKGITVSDWWYTFENFRTDMGERPEGKTLDRINPDKGYEKNNCRWATPKEQAQTNRGCFKTSQVPWNKGVATK